MLKRPQRVASSAIWIRPLFPEDIGLKARSAAGGCLWVNKLSGAGAGHTARDRSLFHCPEHSFSLVKRELAIHSARLPPDVRAKRCYILAENTLNMPFIVEAPVIGRWRTCRQNDSTDNRCAYSVSGHNFLPPPLQCNAFGNLSGKNLAPYNYIE